MFTTAQDLRMLSQPYNIYQTAVLLGHSCFLLISTIHATQVINIISQCCFDFVASLHMVIRLQLQSILSLTSNSKWIFNKMGIVIIVGVVKLNIDGKCW